MPPTPPLDYTLGPALAAYLQEAATQTPAPQHLPVLDALAQFIKQPDKVATRRGWPFCVRTTAAEV